MTDADWIRHSVKALAWAIPGDVRVFASTAEEEAGLGFRVAGVTPPAVERTSRPRL